MLKIIFIFFFFLSLDVSAETRAYIFPSNMKPNFQKDVSIYLQESVKRLHKGDVAIYIPYPSDIKCVFTSTSDSPKRNLKKYNRFRFDVGSQCQSVMKILRESNNNSTMNNYVEVADVSDKVIDYIDNFESSEIILFTSPLFVDRKTSIDFNKGYPSLGHLEEQAKFLSPFSISFSHRVSNNPKVHLLYPDDTKSKYVISNKGALLHELKIQYFWNEFFKSRGFALQTYNDISRGLSKRGVIIPPDEKYNKSRDAVYFVDLSRSVKKSNHKVGDKELLVKSDTGQHKTLEKYQFYLDAPAVVDHFYLREWDADSQKGTKLKFIMVDISGNAEVLTLTPSGEEEYKEHRIEVKGKSEIVSVSLYPINQDGSTEVLFNGVWQITDLWAVF